MRISNKRSVLAASLLLAICHSACSKAQGANGQGSLGWRTVYETSGNTETGRYSEAYEYCKRLAAAAPGRARLVTWGVSPQGRPMVALVMSSDGSFSPSTAAKSAKPLVMINNGIHSGEIEGKDAGLILCRDILISKKCASLLDHCNLLFIPVFSVDAHERFGLYNRINQNGPLQMGWRATSVNLNLNRDFMKADSEEMRAMLHLLHTWKPDFFFDNHTTDGADWQYSLQIQVPVAETLASPCAQWARQMVEAVVPQVEKDGFLTSPYFDDVNYNSLQRGLTVSDFGPRYSTGYLAAINRPSMLVETHMLKSYKQRVDTTYAINLRTIEYIGRTAAALKTANRQADTRDAATRPGDAIVMEVATKPDTRPFIFRGLKYQPYRSEITGGMIPAWSHEPENTPTTLRDQYVPSVTVKAPAAYAIPPQWKEIIDRLKLHGISMKRLDVAFSAPCETFRFENVKFPTSPFESRFQPQFSVLHKTEQRTLPPGTLIVPTAQVGARLIMQLLEPEAPDSLIRWGFMNAIFEQKEYFETYAMEPKAQKLLAQSPELKAEFEQQLKDPVFASNPRARLQFLYARSPWNDPEWNAYPIVRLNAEQLEACVAQKGKSK